MKMNKTRFMKIIIGVLLSTILLPADLLTLEQALSIAMDKNRDIIIARNSSEVSRNNATIGNAGMLPNISVTNTYSKSISDNKFTSSTNVTASTNGAESSSVRSQVELNSILFNGGKNYYTYQKLKNILENGEINNKIAVETAIVSVIRAYYQIALYVENLRVADFALNISQSRYQRIKNKVDFGNLLVIELLNAEVDMDTDSITVLDAKLNVENAKRNLNYLLSRNIDLDFSVDSNVNLKLEKDLIYWTQTTLENNSQLLASQLGADQSEIDIKVARAAFLPTLSGTASYGYDRLENDAGATRLNESTGFTTGLNLSFDLYAGQRNRIQMENANISKRSQYAELHQTRSAVEKEVKNAFAIFNNAIFTVKIAGKSLDTAEINFDRSSELFNLGQITTTQFREAQLNLVRAEIRMINEKFTAKFAEVELYRLSGHLPEISSK